jgi:ABC-type branched-subunit amino acid transport system substrate-binding protein
MVGIRRASAAALAIGLLLAACTSSSSSDDAGKSSDTSASGSGATASGGSTQGITDDTIKISLIWSDLSALTEQHLAPEIGNAEQIMEATVADLNAKGGIAGRQIELTSHVLGALSTADTLRQTCLQATEDDKPFAVIATAAVPSQIVQCTAVEHSTLTLGMFNFVESIYNDSQGRLFAVGSQALLSNSVMKELPKIVDEQGDLKGKTIGVIRQDLDGQKELENALRGGLRSVGQKIAADAVLPCPEGSQTCSQHQAAIQRMQSAGVDTVFLLAQTLPASATLEAAQNAQFTPQWITWGENATDTVAKFFANAKDSFNGAYAVQNAFNDYTPEADECNAIATKGGAESFPKTSDGYGNTAVTCLQLQTLAKAIESIEGTIDQASTIAALEKLDPVPVAAGPPATLSKRKHYAGVAAFEVRYSAQTQAWVPTNNKKPIPIP